METARIPRPGEIYRHFKNNLYQIITVATDSETGEQMVVYQALYGDFKTYVRALDMFVSEVDRSKYPQVKQRYRFELREDRTEDTTKHQGDTNKGRIEETSASERTPSRQEDTLYSSHVEKQTVSEVKGDVKAEVGVDLSETPSSDTRETINSILMDFLDANSYLKKLEIVTSNTKHLTNRLVNDMSVALDCTVNDGPLDQRIQELIYCLQAMCRFEDRRLR